MGQSHLAVEPETTQIEIDLKIKNMTRTFARLSGNYSTAAIAVDAEPFVVKNKLRADISERVKLMEEAEEVAMQVRLRPEEAEEAGEKDEEKTEWEEAAKQEEQTKTEGMILTNVHTILARQ